jgi:GMP synthase (glutamine-hydrolysing)
VRAVSSLDGMSARYSPIPHDILSEISTEITNTLKGQVNRVVYDITHKPPGTIEWE